MTRPKLPEEFSEMNGDNQIMPYIKNEVTYEMHVYEGPIGKGRIKIARKVIDGIKHVLIHHVGPEERYNTSRQWVVVEDDI